MTLANFQKNKNKIKNIDKIGANANAIVFGTVSMLRNWNGANANGGSNGLSNAIFRVKKYGKIAKIWSF